VKSRAGREIWDGAIFARESAEGIARELSLAYQAEVNWEPESLADRKSSTICPVLPRKRKPAQTHSTLSIPPDYRPSHQLSPSGPYVKIPSNNVNRMVQILSSLAPSSDEWWLPKGYKPCECHHFFWTIRLSPIREILCWFYPRLDTSSNRIFARHLGVLDEPVVLLPYNYWNYRKNLTGSSTVHSKVESVRVSEIQWKFSEFQSM